jgi:hypothetical protein
MKNDDRFTIFLSPGELFYIAGNQGLKNLPLLSAYFRAQSPDEVRTLLQQGLESLTRRNLAHRLNPRQVEVDPATTSLVKLVGMPDYINVIGSLRKGELPVQVYIYFSKGQNLSVVFKERFFHFTMFREEVALQRSLVGWMGIIGQISERGGNILPPMGDTSEILQKIWAQPEKASELLESRGFSKEEAARQADFLGQITLYSTLNRVRLQDARLVKQYQVTLMGNSANLWVQETSDETTTKGLGGMQLLPASQAASIVLRYLKPEVIMAGPDETIIE